MNEFEELTRYQDELREKRNALYAEATKLQNEIDNIEIKRFNVDDLVGKCLVYKNEFSDTSYYIKVKEIKRLYKGPRLIGQLFYINDKKEDLSLFLYGRSSIDIDGWEKARDRLVEISEEEYNRVLDKAINELKDEFRK